MFKKSAWKICTNKKNAVSLHPISAEICRKRAKGDIQEGRKFGAGFVNNERWFSKMKDGFRMKK